MKWCLAVLPLMAWSTVIPAQDPGTVEIPSQVMETFTLIYPDARQLDWKITDAYYIAEFKNNQMATMAVLTPEGALAKTETQIKIIALPEEARDYIEAVDQDARISRASIFEDQEGRITFEAVADKQVYTFDAEGHCLAVQPGSKEAPRRP